MTYTAGNPATSDRSPIDVDVPGDIADLVPTYLARRKEELPQLWRACADGEFPQITRLAHRIKGNARSFGFSQLTSIGALLEASANRGDATAVRAQLSEMENYLQRVRLRPGK